MEEQNWESLIYSFLELHEVNGAELKVSAWCDSLKKFTYKQVQDAMKNFNETREPWEICGISRVIFRIQKEQKIDYVDLEEKKRLLKSGEIFTKMMALHLKARDLDIMGFFVTNRYSGATFAYINGEYKAISYGEKGAIIDHIANEFKNTYGHSADKPWQLSLQYNYKANQEEILLQEA